MATGQQGGGARPRLSELDVLRALAAIGVVAIHATSTLLVTVPRDGHAFWWASLINQASRFSIGAFVLITGVALYHTYGRRERFDVLDFYRRRLRGVVVPYLFWTAIYLLYDAHIERRYSGLAPTYLRDLLTGNAYAHLYFVVMIVQFYLLFPLIRTAVRSRWLVPGALAVVAIQLYLTAAVFYGFGFVHVSLFHGLVRASDRYFPWWMGYFAVGALVAGRLTAWQAFARRRVWLLVAVAAALLVWMMVEYGLYMENQNIMVAWAASEYRPSANLYALVVSLALLAVGQHLAAAGGAVLRGLLALGKHSYGIYLIHPLVLALFDHFAPRLHLDPALYFGLGFVLAFGLSYLASLILAALPGGALLVGTTAVRPPASRAAA